MRVFATGMKKMKNWESREKKKKENLGSLINFFWYCLNFYFRLQNAQADDDNDDFGGGGDDFD
jgi:hypothetical protein